MPDLDVAILGGGCAGLSLAERLAEEPGRVGSVAVFEARDGYRPDRTWSFWRQGAHRFESLVRTSWDRMRVRGDGREALVDCAAFPYQALQAQDFYDHCVQRLGSSGVTSLELGAAVEGEPRRSGDGWTLTVGGEEVRAREIVDTRPPDSLPECLLWQSFSGCVVRTDRARFEPGVATLMDLAPGDPGAVAFTYVLPWSEREALVEWTVFAPEKRSAEQLGPGLAQAVARASGGASVHVEREESGALPMGPIGPRTTAPWVRAGLFAGAARPATGYAFQRIQRWADRCAERLRAGQPAVGARPDGAVTRAMDRVFLEVLRADAARAPELFLDLFTRTEPARLVRFLSDGATLGDALAVVRALPPRPFLRRLPAALPEVLQGGTA